MSNREGRTKTEGAIRGGHGKYYFRLAEVKDVPAGTGYSSAHGGVVEGKRMLVGYIKDLSQGIIGKAVDGTMTGPRYDPGFASPS